jgi:hypothetical protein
VIVIGETYTASKTEETPSNEKTDMLHDTWAFKEYEIIEDLVQDDEKQRLISKHGSGSDWKAKEEQEMNSEDKELTVTFTKAETYFTRHIGW